MWSPNEYNEVPANDLRNLVRRIEALAQQNKVGLAITPDQLHQQLIQYVLLRQKTHWGNITLRRPGDAPKGWTPAQENVWRDWLAYQFPLDVWQEQVLAPVFGTDVRGWEMGVEGWRDEILYYLPQWLQRSADIVAAFDPTPLDEPVEEEKSKLDTYLLEHGTSRQRRAALSALGRS